MSKLKELSPIALLLGVLFAVYNLVPIDYLSGSKWNFIFLPFFHADKGHILGNASCLVVAGAYLEHYNPVPKMYIYMTILGSVILGTMLYFTFAPVGSMYVGASGIAYGIFTFAGLYAGLNHLGLAFKIILAYMAWDAYSGIGNTTTIVAHSVHFAGVLAGVFTYAFYSYKNKIFFK